MRDLRFYSWCRWNL